MSSAILFAVPVFAHTGNHHVNESHSYDSLLPEKKITSSQASFFLDLLDAENNYSHSGTARKTMSKLIRIAGLKKTIHNNSLGSRLFFDLANISTRLKFYPLAMKCYSRGILLNQKKTSSSHITALYISDSSAYAELLKAERAQPASPSPYVSPESLPVSVQDVLCSFEDGKTALSYAVIVHVKQPRHGRRKAFTGIDNVGHTFITLIKLNTDNSSVSRSFGFYPAKKSFLSATPVHPDDSPVIKDDALHPWDETIGKFISENKFHRILDNLQKFSTRRYNLNKNNCTDFGLSEAFIAGFQINETLGYWPLGQGNNPANAGQSLLEKKFENNDTDHPETLVVNEGQGIFNEIN